MKVHTGFPFILTVYVLAKVQVGHFLVDGPIFEFTVSSGYDTSIIQWAKNFSSSVCVEPLKVSDLNNIIIRSTYINCCSSG